MSPVIGQILSRLPGRDIPLSPSFSVSRGTGLPTFPNSMLGLDPATMNMNGLWSEWTSGLLSTQPAWMQQWAFENRQDLFSNEALQETAFRAWKDRLNGISIPTHYEVVAQPLSLGTSIRERIAIVMKHAMFKLGSPTSTEDIDQDPTILYCKRALSLMSNMICDASVTRSIHDFLADEEPLVSDGRFFSECKHIFKAIKMEDAGKTKKEKKLFAAKAAQVITVQAEQPQNLRDFLEIVIDNPLEPCPRREYDICKIVTFEQKTTSRRHFPHQTGITSTKLYHEENAEVTNSDENPTRANDQHTDEEIRFDEL